MNISTKLPNVGENIFSIMSRLAGESNAINLAQGFPDFNPPEYILERLNAAATNGKNQYCPMPGLPRLREQIARKCEVFQGHPPSFDTEITITNGASGALYVAITALIHTGDNVLVFDPSYDSYVPAIELSGAKATRVQLKEGEIPWNELETMDRNFQAIIVNTPHNPMGYCMDSSDWKRLAELFPSSLLISDEVYEHITFDTKHVSAWSMNEWRGSCVVIGSFGKIFHMTGWKVGYTIASKAITTEIRKIHQYNSFCIATPMQEAIADMLEHHFDELYEISPMYQKKRDFLIEALKQHTALRPLPCDGSFFLLAEYPTDRFGDLGDRELCELLVKEYGVALIPMSPFCERPLPKNLIRFCFAKSEAVLEQAAMNLGKAFPK